MVFVNFMSDLFQDGVPDEYIITVARVMVMPHWYTFQVLTKRTERLRDRLRDRLDFAHMPAISGGGSVSKINGMACRVLHSSVLPRYRYVFSRLSHSLRTWAD
jgi:protein gp37